jgi:insulysin
VGSWLPVAHCVAAPGSKKYPDENSFNVFLAAHGGGTNAYTDQQDTNFYFYVSWEYLAEALDRFSQFFTAPLLTEGSMYREMQAVDSEHKKNLQNDDWRLFQLLKSVSSPCT